MASRPEAQRHDMAEVYVEKRLEGQEAREAARAAGYSENTKIAEIERPHGPVATLMAQALSRCGIDADWLAGEYRKGIEQAQIDGAREKDLNAHAQYLKQLGYLLGYGKPGPTVAVQINNQAAPEHLEPGRVEEALREVSVLLDELKAAIGERESTVVHERDTAANGGNPLLVEAGTRDGVEPLGPDARPAPGGGGA